MCHGDVIQNGAWSDVLQFLWCSTSGPSVSACVMQIGKGPGWFFPCVVDGRKRLFQEQVAFILFLYLTLKSLNLFNTGPH